MATRKVNAIIERANDGTYSIYMDADEMDYLVTGTGKTVSEAMNMFIGGYEDMRRYYEEEGRAFEEVDFDFKYDMAFPNADFGATVRFSAHAEKASKTGFSCFSRCS